MSRVNQYGENRAVEARKALAKWVCYAEVPFASLLDDEGPFKLFSDNLNLGFHSNLTTLESLQQDCMEIYKEDRKKAAEILSKVDGKISLSVDWSIYDTCVNAHFIDNDWKLKKWVIKYYGGDEGFRMDSFPNCLKEWDIDGKLLTLIGDIDIANLVKEDIQKRRELVLNGELFHVQNSCDVITRMAQSSFEMIDEIIFKVQLLAWSRSIEPVWHLTTHKLQNALKMEAVGEFSVENIGDEYDVPTEEEWEKVRSICRITDRIYQITKPLYEAKKQTANIYLPHLLEIRAYLAQESASSDPFVKSVTQKMLKTYTMYWSDMYLVLAIAAFMDPRYKMRLIEFSASKLRCDEKAAHVLETIRKVYDGYAVDNDPMEYVSSDTNSEYDEEEDEEGSEMEEDKEFYNLLDKLDVLKEFCSVQSVTDQTCKSDLDLYLYEPVLPYTENFSVLHWWKDNCVKYPQLSRMARDFLAIPMTLATSHDAYYTEPRESDTTMAGLKSELMNALKCTRSWKLGSNNRH